MAILMRSLLISGLFATLMTRLPAGTRTVGGLTGFASYAPKESWSFSTAGIVLVIAIRRGIAETVGDEPMSLIDARMERSHRSGEQMVRVQSTAEASGWILSVAEVLPLPHRAVAPYTLGEAVAELGAYAQAVDASKWDVGFAKASRAAMRIEIDAQSETLGERLGTLVAAPLDDLRDAADPVAAATAAARFSEAWHSEMAITHAFDDLCDAAKIPTATSRALRKLSAIVASQVGPAARDAFSLLDHAANALVDTEEDLARWRNESLSEPLTEAHRLEVATDILAAAPAGRIVVWTAYYRARIMGMREVAGPMTFLRPDWALPNAFDVHVSDFPERAELREIREGVHWLDELHTESLKPGNRLVLVRVDLGERQVAGAVEEARRRIDAVLSVAVEAGGTSWQHTGAAAVLLDGKVRRSSIGLTLRATLALEDDSYGIGATAEILGSVAEQLDVALTKGPMPEHLLEALTTLREARMTDHRDVRFYGSRRVTPRIATALEDHAMELFASVLKVKPDELAMALQRREALSQASRRIANQLMAPFSEAWSLEHHEDRQELERKISKYSQGGLLVSVATAVALGDRIRALPMSDLQRADFEDALAICVDPVREQRFLDDIWRETELLRARHRRVRNAVSHGLPLNDNTLNSIRDYADATSGAALNIALTWFKNSDTGETLLKQEDKAWADRLNRIRRGETWAADDART